MHYSLVEPNPVTGRPLTRGFLSELRRFNEDSNAIVRNLPGLMPISRGVSMKVYQDPPDHIQLDGIHAVGELGHLISTYPFDSGSAIKPIDCSKLSHGVYDVFVCLCHEKALTGGVTDVPGNGNRDRRAIARFLKSRIVLAIGDEHLQHRDWLKVAEIERVREGGFARTLIDSMYHPPIIDMKAYQFTPNPLKALAAHALERLEFDSSNPLDVMMRVELIALQSISEQAPPALAFLQTQRCLQYLVERQDQPFFVGVGLENASYSHHTFCSFLRRLSINLAQDSNVTCPKTIEINGQLYHKLSGDLSEDDEFWTWTPEKSGFNVNCIAIYLPKAKPGTTPNIHYSQDKLDPSGFRVASSATMLDVPGTALILDEISSSIKKIYVAVNTVTLQQRLKMQLKEGHAIYYY